MTVRPGQRLDDVHLFDGDLHAEGAGFDFGG